jgi:hypothetical protein
MMWVNYTFALLFLILSSLERGWKQTLRHYGKYAQTTPQYFMVSMNSDVGLFIPEIMEYSQT